MKMVSKAAQFLVCCYNQIHIFFMNIVFFPKMSTVSSFLCFSTCLPTACRLLLEAAYSWAVALTQASLEASKRLFGYHQRSSNSGGCVHEAKRTPRARSANRFKIPLQLQLMMPGAGVTTSTSHHGGSLCFCYYWRYLYVEVTVLMAFTD